MINKIKKLTIDDLRMIAEYFLSLKCNTEYAISEIGQIVDQNGYGTFFIQPANPTFKGAWVNVKDSCIDTIALGTEQSDIKLSDMASKYNNVREGFIPKDNDHIYSFYNENGPSYSIIITSPEKLMSNNEITNNITIYSFKISFW